MFESLNAVSLYSGISPNSSSIFFGSIFQILQLIFKTFRRPVVKAEYLPQRHVENVAYIDKFHSFEKSQNNKAHVLFQHKMQRFVNQHLQIEQFYFFRIHFDYFLVEFHRIVRTVRIESAGGAF